jgi:hypothetical protein
MDTICPLAFAALVIAAERTLRCDRTLGFVFRTTGTSTKALAASMAGSCDAAHSHRITNLLVPVVRSLRRFKGVLAACRRVSATALARRGVCFAGFNEIEAADLATLLVCGVVERLARD